MNVLKASSRSELWNFRYLFSNAGASKIVFRRNLKGINSVIDLSLQIHVYTFCVFEKNKKLRTTKNIVFDLLRKQKNQKFN